VHSFDGTHAGHLLRSNGAALATTNGVFTTNPGTATISSQLWIGAVASGGSLWLQGDVGELLVYDRNLSLTEQQSLESYLNGRFMVY
jgi:hypothetical protein